MNRTMKPSPCPRPHGALPALALAILLSGCATLTPDSGFPAVAEVARKQLGHAPVWPRSEAERAAVEQRVAELLAGPLAADDAVQLALLNNRGLQAALADLGIADAERVQALRLPNPGFSFARLRRGDATEIDRSVHVDLARLLTLPWRGPLEAQRFEQARQGVAARVLRLAADTRRAWVQAVAAAETVRYMQQVQAAAEAGAELARRQAQAGNWNRLQQAREQSFYADAALNLARAEQARIAARERLIRLLGLWGAQTDVRLPERLPELPAAPKDLPDVEQRAMAQRLDVQAARESAAQLAQGLGLARASRFVNVLELGAVRNSESGSPVQKGYELRVELPLFDSGDARIARAEALHRQAVERTAEVAINARSEVREAYAGYRIGYDLARHYRDEVVPLKKRISEEQLLRYNGMLIGVFELLADARSQIGSVNGYIEALRDFWLAEAELDAALLGLPGAIPRNSAMPLPTGDAPAAH